MDSENILCSGAILDSGRAKYRIINVLGQGGFGITYLVYGELKVGNVTTEARFAIKEHFPSVFCSRNGDTVAPKPDKVDEYNRSKADFIAEARKLHALGSKNENIVKVNEVFEANGTAYYVMQYINGQSLSSLVEKKGKLPYSQAIELLRPIIDAVEFLHSSRINHLDIKPDNIMLHEGIHGITPVLIDFGLSVHFKKNGEKTSPKGVQGVSEGYSPLEQYAGITEFIPAADIYSLMATLLYMLTGSAPKSAAEIRLDDVKIQLAKAGVPAGAIEGICKAMNMSHIYRTQSVAVLKADLGLNAASSDNITQILAIKEQEIKRKNNLIKIVGGTLAAVVLGILISWLIGSPKTDTTDDLTAMSDTLTEPIATVEPQPMANITKVEEAKPAKEVEREQPEKKPEEVVTTQNTQEVVTNTNNSNHNEVVTTNSPKPTPQKSDSEILSQARSAYHSGDYTKARALFMKVQHNATAQYYLACMYTFGDGVSRNYNEAASWYLKSATQGNVDAQYNIGACYANGQGVPRNEEQAIFWFKKAAEKGDQDAIEALRKRGLW